MSGTPRYKRTDRRMHFALAVALAIFAVLMWLVVRRWGLG